MNRRAKLWCFVTYYSGEIIGVIAIIALIVMLTTMRIT